MLRTKYLPAIYEYRIAKLKQIVQKKKNTFGFRWMKPQTANSDMLSILCLEFWVSRKNAVSVLSFTVPRSIFNLKLVLFGDKMIECFLITFANSLVKPSMEFHS